MRGVDEEEHGLVREQAARRLEVQLEHGVDAEAASDPLVGERRVDVAVAEHGGAAGEGRGDHPLDQLRAGRGEQGGLGPGDDLLVAVEDDLADGLAELGAARLASRDDFAALRLERALEELDLRRLARAVEALEGDEHAGQHREEPGRVGRNGAPVDYPVQANRWRTRALLFAAIATLELLALVGVGSLVAARLLAGEVETAARARELPATKRDTPAPTSPKRPVLERTETSVVVLNGNGISGAAGEAAGRLRTLTYVVAGAGNAPRTDYAKTIVEYRPGYEREARRLAADVGVKLVGPLDGLRAKDLMGAHLALVLGR